ncbi:MAG: (d)CMP kinase [Gammaproteobacteria bacterium]|nr:(d)CMP kinase [Gammaproteobacteria bacterium]MDE2251658.1 (d)CMP kinase [Gammaproteobacteria bacterium]
MNPAVVTIDGPSGAGKGTISRALAGRLGWHLLDSGALYRLVAFAGLQQGLAADDRAGHTRLAQALDSRFGARADGTELIELQGVDVTQGIRSEASGMGASRIAAWPELRSALLARQQAFAQPPGLVADGRDMGTVVFPTAPLKIFLMATPEERALRRYKQLKGKDSGVSLAALSREIAARDRRDATRPVAPLVPAGDAVVIDSTGLSVAEVVERVWRLGGERGLWQK